MKRMLLPVLSLLMVFSAVSCNQEKDYSDMKGVIALVAENIPEAGIFEVNERQQKTVNIKVAAESICGSTLNITVGVDPKLVADYNAANDTEYELLPSDSYSFVDAEVMLPYFNTESSLGQINLIGRGCVENQVYLLPLVISAVTGSDNYEISAENNAIYLLFKMLPALKGTGTQDDPYLIMEVDDILEMNDKLLSDEEVYFKMVEDIDMAEDSDYFIPVNGTKPYNKIIHFDGQGHKISNLKTSGGFFTVFIGTLENVIFENCTVDAGGKTDRAVVANYFGYTGNASDPADVALYAGDKFKKNKAKNVIVRNAKNSNNGDRAAIFCSRSSYSVLEQISLENCDLNCGGRRTGMLCSYDETAITIKNCYIKGGNHHGTQQIGGYIGQLNFNTAITYCGCSASFTSANSSMGCIVGQTGTGTAEVTISNCIAWSPSMVSQLPFNESGTDKYSSGAVYGCLRYDTNIYHLSNCYYRPDMEFKEYTGLNPLKDMADLDGHAVMLATNTWPWHGKAAAAGKTASDVAKDLGWDETIWDLSGDEPVLKTIK